MMMGTELREIKDYWDKKYPNVFIRLWGNSANDQFYGKMMANDKSLDINARTIGELINQGECFLRRMKW